MLKLRKEKTYWQWLEARKVVLESNALIFVYKITCRKSFYDAACYIAKLKATNLHRPMMLIGTFGDIKREFQVSSESIKKVTSKNGIPVSVVLDATDRSAVQDAIDGFLRQVREFLESRIPPTVTVTSTQKPGGWSTDRILNLKNSLW
mmetsp:Transcript_3979/g.4401  ORF Transcript_3979/g.4401 Transcript_3979/m.4401 type:complete len:148 (+) Transcript_3979:172-615(+)